MKRRNFITSLFASVAAVPLVKVLGRPDNDDLTISGDITVVGDNIIDDYERIKGTGRLGKIGFQYITPGDMVIGCNEPQPVQWLSWEEILEKYPI